jgi:hypothetical protein
MATHTKNHNQRSNSKSELTYADKAIGEEYAEIIAAKGNCRFEARIISTGVTVNVPIRGKLSHGKTKQLISKEDIVLLVPDVSDGYIINLKYLPDEVKILRKAGELTQIVKSIQTSGVTVAFGNEAIAAKKENIEIDDDVIANL